MKKLIIVGTFIAGAVAGFFAGWKTMERKYAEMADQEIQDVKDAYGRRLDHIEDEHQAELDRLRGPGENELNESLERAGEVARNVRNLEAFRNAPNPLSRSSLDNNPYEQAKTNYSLAGRQAASIDHDDNRSDNDPSEDDEKDEGSQTDAAGRTERDLTSIDRTEPYVITSDEFLHEFDHHEKESLYYYTVDDVLTDDQLEPVKNQLNVVGQDAINRLSVEQNVWVRNEPLTTDYEIIRVTKSFKESVLGITTPTSRSRRRRATENDGE